MANDSKGPGSTQPGGEGTPASEHSLETLSDTTLETRLEEAVPSTHKEAAEIRRLIKGVLPSKGGHLKHLAPLAKGGMGQVEVVLDVGLQRRLAKKVIAGRLLEKARAVRLFLREAQITGQLDHPSIVPVHEVGLDQDGRLFFTMKLVEGKTLDVWAGEAGIEARRLPELIEVVIKLGDALAFAHHRGVIHGDLKPANVMVGEYGEVYLMDWGLASLAPKTHTSTSEVLREDTGATAAGTPAFMAPEQALGQPIEARTDVFGLGALLYCALEGRPPYDADSVPEALMQAREARWAPLNRTESRARVPRELARIVAKAMAAAPEDRYPTVQAFGHELRVFLRGGAEFPRREAAAGEHILRQGETGDEVFLLVSGRVRVYQEIDGAIVERGEMGPGEVFGEMAILVGSPRTASVVAIEECVLRILTGETLERELHGMKPWLATLVRTLAQRLRRREEEQAKGD